MDPDALLADLLMMARATVNINDAACTNDRDDEYTSEHEVEMAQAVLDLDEWIVKGGFLPRRWRDAQAKPKPAAD